MSYNLSRWIYICVYFVLDIVILLFLKKLAIPWDNDAQSHKRKVWQVLSLTSYRSRRRKNLSLPQKSFFLWLTLRNEMDRLTKAVLGWKKKKAVGFLQLKTQTRRLRKELSLEKTFTALTAKRGKLCCFKFKYLDWVSWVEKKELLLNNFYFL